MTGYDYDISIPNLDLFGEVLKGEQIRVELA